MQAAEELAELVVVIVRKLREFGMPEEAIAGFIGGAVFAAMNTELKIDA